MDTSYTKCKRQYKYVPVLLDLIEKEKTDKTLNAKTKTILTTDHPAKIQQTIGYSELPVTISIITKKHSKFR